MSWSNPEYLSIEEVNGLIPRLNLVFQRLIELRKEIVEEADELKRLGFDPTILDARSGSDSGTRSDDSPKEVSKRVRDLRDRVFEFEEELQKISSVGGILRDLDLGLVDFRHELDGEEVLLCWQFGEPSVGHFHAPDTGFEARRRLPNERNRLITH